MTGCEDGRLYIYDLMKKNPIKSIQAHKKVLSALDLHESGGLVSGGHDGTVCFWKI
jgi:WD40 repeat protein